MDRVSAGTRPSFFAALDDHREKTVGQLGNVLRLLPKKVVGAVQIAELCAVAEYPNGLYLLYGDDDELWYVGKSTSRSFVERIPAHFDQRPDAWFNTLPKAILNREPVTCFAEALQLALSLRIVLLGVRTPASATRLESALRSVLLPRLNAAARSKYAAEEMVEKYA